MVEPPMNPAARRVKLATVSLAGCFGCHMSLLDIDERVVELAQKVELTRSPLTDIRSFVTDVDIGFVEGGVCNDKNVHVLREFRTHCKTLVACGECAIMGGLPALRNSVSLRSCLEEAYVNVPTTVGCDSASLIPNSPEIPRILDKVYPCHEVVKMDYFLPGCPPSADAIWSVVNALAAGEEPHLAYGLLKYD